MDESVVKFLEQDQSESRIKCSTAMRIGAAIRPKARFAFYRGGASCAMGAALEGTGFPVWEMATMSFVHNKAIWDALHARFPEMYSDVRVCPESGARGSAHSICANLNNDYGWSRERIADWLEQEGL